MSAEGLRVVLARASLASVMVFSALYAVATALYPGGSRFDPTSRGFSFENNYWCDLFNATAYSGQANPARPVAVAATIVLALGLAALWWIIPSLFGRSRLVQEHPGAAKRAIFVRSAGLLSAALTPFVATAHHHLAVRASALLGFAAFIMALSAIPMTRNDPLRAITMGALGAAILNYGSWESGLGLRALPLIQKFAFAGFLAWAVVVARRAGSRSASTDLRPPEVQRAPPRVKGCPVSARRRGRDR